MFRLMSYLCMVVVVFASLSVHGQYVWGSHVDHSVPMASMEMDKSGNKDCCSKHGKASIPGSDNCTISCVAIVRSDHVSMGSGIDKYTLASKDDGNEWIRARLKRPPKLTL